MNILSADPEAGILKIINGSLKMDQPGGCRRSVSLLRRSVRKIEQKLTKRMAEAINALKTYGEYELWELTCWNSWHPVVKNLYAPSIRTDTMKGLIKRGLVEET